MKAGETVEQGGKKYLVLGKTFGTKTKLSPGDRFVLEGETLNLERDDSGKVIKASVWVPEVIEATDKAADSLEAIVERAKEHGILQEKVRHEGGEVEYLPTDAGKPSTASKSFEGAAIMLFLPTEQAKKLIALVDVNGAKPTKPKDMHLTLVFLGKAKELEEKHPLIEAALEQFAKTTQPISGKVGGVGRFLKEEEDGTNAVYASFDSPGLSALRERLVSSLADIGVELGSDHDFTPHITLAYAPTDSWELPKVEPVEVEFDKVTLGWGDERKAYHLRGKEAEKGRWVTIGGHPVYIEESRGVPSGKVADSYMTWKSEDTITGNMVVEHKEDKPPTNEQLELFVIDNLANEVESLRGPKDVESVKITNREEGPGWVSFEVDVTPTEAAGDRWLEEEGGTEEWLTYHGQSSYDEKAETEAYPDESKKLRFVAQNHYRGKSCHLDMRFEYKRGDADYLRGWTVAHQVAGAIKAPVTTMAEARKLDANPGNWKMDLKTGEIKPRQIRGGTVRRGDLRAFQKAAEIPKDWLDTEGVTEKQDPGERPPAGATRQFPGVFTILDKGEVEWGAQKPWFTEFFLEGGKWKGRWCFRLVKREGKKFFSPESLEEYEAIKAEILPPGKEEEEARTGSYWVLMQPESQLPYVLSKEATSEDWLPPKGVSCLPAKMRKSVPKELQFWTMDRKEALEARDKLAEFEELGGTELKLVVLRELTDG